MARAGYAAHLLVKVHAGQKLANVSQRGVEQRLTD